MMYSITEAIYRTYTTAAFLRVPEGDPWGRPSRRLPAPTSHDAQARRPTRSLLVKARKASGRALTALGAALQVGGDRLIGAEPTGS